MSLDWTHGNQIALLENGEAYYPRVFEAIAQARHEVLLETFILFDDKVGRQLQQALLQAARNGAQVHVLVDGWGSPDLGAEMLDPLADAGVQVRAYEPVRSLFGRRLNVFRRMHRKLVVVDDTVAFVGGINYSIDHLAEFGAMAKQDYAIEVAGPLVSHIRAFCREALHTPQPRRRRWRWRRERGPRRRGARSVGCRRAGDARQRAPPARHRAAVPGRAASRAPARGDRQCVLLSRLPAAARHAACRAPRRAGRPDRARRTRHGDRALRRVDAVRAPAARRRARARVLQAAVPRQGGGGRRRVGHRGLEQPRPVEPGAQPRGQRDRARPPTSRCTCANTWTR